LHGIPEEKKRRDKDGKDRPAPSPSSVDLDSPFDGRGGKDEEHESGRPAERNEYSSEVIHDGG
jgi:hypothetical protein